MCLKQIFVSLCIYHYKTEKSEKIFVDSWLILYIFLWCENVRMRVTARRRRRKKLLAHCRNRWANFWVLYYISLLRCELERFLFLFYLFIRISVFSFCRIGWINVRATPNGLLVVIIRLVKRGI